MKRIAIITPAILPVPAVKGGAVEELITKLIQGNEENPQYNLDVYTIADEQLTGMTFQHTKLIPIEYPGILKLADRMLDKLERMFNCRKSHRLLDLVIAAKVLQAMKLKAKYDHIVVENMSSQYRVLYKKTDVPITFHIHNHVDMYRSEADFREMKKRGDLVLAVSEYLRGQVARTAEQIKCKVLYNSVDRQKFAASTEEQKKKSREKYGIAAGKFVFLYSGRLLPQKGVRELLTAFGEVKKKNDKATLVIVGKALFERQNQLTEYEAEINRLAEQTEDVLFTGFVAPEVMPEVYAAADVVVMPSVWEEPFGMVALEALSMGIPLIVTKTGGLSEVADENCSVCVEVGNLLSQSLAEKMTQLMESASLREELSRKALEQMAQRKQFDDKYYFENFCSLLDISERNGEWV